MEKTKEKKIEIPRNVLARMIIITKIRANLAKIPNLSGIFLVKKEYEEKQPEADFTLFYPGELHYALLFSNIRLYLASFTKSEIESLREIIASTYVSGFRAKIESIEKKIISVNSGRELLARLLEARENGNATIILNVAWWNRERDIMIAWGDKDSLKLFELLRP